MSNLDKLIKRFPDEPDVQEGGRIYRGYTPAEYVKTPPGFTEVEAFGEYPYRVVWVSHADRATFCYCEHDLILHVYDTEESFWKGFKEAIWFYAIHERIHDAANIFQVGVRKGVLGYEESYYYARNIYSELFQKLQELGLKSDEFHYKWTSIYLSLFYNAFESQDDINRLQENKECLSEIFADLESNIPDIDYWSEHNAWMCRGEAKDYLDDVTKPNTGLNSFEEMLKVAEANERLDVQNIVQNFIEWLLYDYEDNMCKVIDNGNSPKEEPLCPIS